MKFKANELLESMNRELLLPEVNEIYKALIAYSIGLDIITENTDKELDKVIEFYYNNNDICGIINQEVFDYADEIIEEIH